MISNYGIAKNIGWDEHFLSLVDQIKSSYQLDYEIRFYEFTNDQSADDVLVYNFFKDLNNGRFLCIGSATGQDQTRALLEKGWTGVYCDPDPMAWPGLLDFTKDFQDQVTLVNTAIMPQCGLYYFYISETTALSTTKKELATNNSRSSIVSSTTLSQLLDFVGDDFDYVQFDIEGMDSEVIKSIDWSRLLRCQMIGVEGELDIWEQLWKQGNYVLSDISQHNVYYCRANSLKTTKTSK